jgi:hypothetical protein
VLSDHFSTSITFKRHVATQRPIQRKCQRNSTAHEARSRRSRQHQRVQALSAVLDHRDDHGTDTSRSPPSLHSSSPRSPLAQREDRRSLSGNVPTYSLGPNPNLATPADQPGRWKHDRFDRRQAGVPNNGGDAFGPGGRRRGDDDDVKYGPERSVAPTRKLVIEDLHYEVTQRELGKLFGEIGPIKSGPDVLVRPSLHSQTLFNTLKLIHEPFPPRRSLTEAADLGVLHS